MANILDIPTLPEMPFLQQLADDLDEILSGIAFGDALDDPGYVLAMKRYVREKYGPYLEHVKSLVGQMHILAAYDTLMSEVYGFYTDPDDIREACAETLYLHLIFPEPGVIEDEGEPINPFENFYRENG